MKFDRMINPSQFKNFWGEIKTILNYCTEKNRNVHVLIEPQKKLRSTGAFSQSHHLNGHIQQIAMYTGQPFEDVKKYIKQQAISMGYPFQESFGNPKRDMWGNLVGISEAESTTEQCALLIEQAHMLAAELDITLQENDNGWNY